ncbi:MAG TPA: hypothetical protein VLS89_14935 [Candidatus Nanopelagicales bacterium]|nr:hypothetical protein [Candidatus Nanopelagicales bacterium]
MTRFADFFALRDRDRESLAVSPEHDAKLFVDLDRVLPRVRDMLRGVPRLILFGDYGTGKSHLLRHIQDQMAPDMRYRAVYVVLSGFQRRSRFQHVHALVMQKMEDVLIPLLQGTRDIRGWIEARRDVDEDVRRALVQLADPSTKEPDRARLRAWLKGPGITTAELRRLGLSGRLVDTCGPAQLVDLWKCIGEMHQQHALDRSSLLLLFDEGESIQQALSPEGQHDLANGFRALLDPDNRSLGCVFGLNLPGARATHPFLRTDVARRILDSTLSLQALGGPLRVRAFAEALWAMLAEPDAPPLLDTEALAQVAQHLALLRDKLGLTLGPPNRMPTQSDLIHVLNRLAQAAFQARQPPPIPADWIRDALQVPGS